MTVQSSWAVARRTSVIGTSTASNRRPMLRAVRIGDSVSVTGCTIRATDVPVAQASIAAVRGWRSACRVAGTAPRAARAANRAACSALSATDAASRSPAFRRPTGSSGPSGSIAGMLASASTTRASICTPAMPSARQWCSFVTNALRPPSRPSMRVNSHSGRSRSNAAISEVWAKSRTPRQSAGCGARIRRRW